MLSLLTLLFVRFVCCNRDGCNWSLVTALTNTSPDSVAAWLPYLGAALVAVILLAGLAGLCAGTASGAVRYIPCPL